MINQEIILQEVKIGRVPADFTIDSVLSLILTPEEVLSLIKMRLLDYPHLVFNLDSISEDVLSTEQKEKFKHIVGKVILLVVGGVDDQLDTNATTDIAQGLSTTVISYIEAQFIEAGFKNVEKWTEQFLQPAVLQFIQATAEEVRMKSNNEIFESRDYVAHRKHTSMQHALLSFSALYNEYPQDTKIIDLALKLMTIRVDLVSWKKDAKNLDPYNYLATVFRDFAHSMPNEENRALWEITLFAANSAYQDAFDKFTSLPESPIKQFFIHWLEGDYEWVTTTSRYQLKQDESDDIQNLEEYLNYVKGLTRKKLDTLKINS